MPLVLLLPIQFFSKQLYSVFKDEQYIYFHLAMHASHQHRSCNGHCDTDLVRPFTIKDRSNVLHRCHFIYHCPFRVVNIIEVYPFVLANTIATPYLAMWLHLIMRFLLAVSFILMIVKSEKYLQSNSQVLTYGKVSVFAVITLMILNNPPHFLQQFIVEGIQQPLWQYAYK